MNIKRLNNQSDFDRISKNDFIIIEFKDTAGFDYDFTVKENCFINHINELIFDKKKNYYINIPMYLAEKSHVAKNVYLLESEVEQ